MKRSIISHIRAFGKECYSFRYTLRHVRTIRGLKNKITMLRLGIYLKCHKLVDPASIKDES